MRCHLAWAPGRGCRPQAKHKHRTHLAHLGRSSCTNEKHVMARSALWFVSPSLSLLVESKMLPTDSYGREKSHRVSRQVDVYKMYCTDCREKVAHPQLIDNRPGLLILWTLGNPQRTDENTRYEPASLLHQLWIPVEPSPLKFCLLAIHETNLQTMERHGRLGTALRWFNISAWVYTYMCCIFICICMCVCARVYQMQRSPNGWKRCPRPFLQEVNGGVNIP